MMSMWRRKPREAHRLNEPNWAEIVQSVSYSRERKIRRFTDGLYSGYPVAVQQHAAQVAVAAPSSDEAIDAIDRVLSTWETEASAWDRIMCA